MPHLCSTPHNNDNDIKVKIDRRVTFKLYASAERKIFPLKQNQTPVTAVKKGAGGDAE